MADNIRSWPISVAGRWTPRQLERVLPVIAAQMWERGLRVGLLEVTEHRDLCPWFLITTEPRNESYSEESTGAKCRSTGVG